MTLDEVSGEAEQPQHRDDGAAATGPPPRKKTRRTPRASEVLGIDFGKMTRLDELAKDLAGAGALSSFQLTSQNIAAAAAAASQAQLTSQNIAAAAAAASQAQLTSQNIAAAAAAASQAQLTSQNIAAAAAAASQAQLTSQNIRLITQQSLLGSLPLPTDQLFFDRFMDLGLARRVANTETEDPVDGFAEGVIHEAERMVSEIPESVASTLRDVAEVVTEEGVGFVRALGDHAYKWWTRASLFERFAFLWAALFVLLLVVACVQGDPSATLIVNSLDESALAVGAAFVVKDIPNGPQK